MKTKKEIAAEHEILSEDEIYTREEFEELVDCGAFIPYDGIGYFHDGEDETEVSVWDETLTPEDVEKYPYVCWYNR